MCRQISLSFIRRAFGISLVILTGAIGCLAHDAIVCHSNSTFTCGTDDLSHSVLVECNVTNCAYTNSNRPSGQNGNTADWPSHPNEIIHIHSSRSGSRFTRTKLPYLDFEEDDHQRMLDINTTFYIYTSGEHHTSANSLAGFGATVEYWPLDRALVQNQFERLFGLLFADLFDGTEQSNRFNLLRLLIDTSNMKTLDLQAGLLRLDNRLSYRNRTREGKLKILVDFHGNMNRSEVKLGPNINFTNIDIWAISDETGFFVDQIHDTMPEVPLFRSSRPFEAIDFVDSTGNLATTKVKGMLIRSESSIPYNYLQYIRRRVGQNRLVLTAGRMLPKTQSLGDWQNAQESAIELMNHIKHGSNGFIEDRSLVDVLHDPSATSDASLYSLHDDHGLHLRGPKFYTMGHFSRYVEQDSVPLRTELFTQPNMFAAHYSAFMSRNSRYIICIVINGNEHLLPFRLAIDRRIRAVENLEAMSINTFLINID